MKASEASLFYFIFNTTKMSCIQIMLLLTVDPECDIIDIKSVYVWVILMQSSVHSHDRYKTDTNTNVNGQVRNLGVKLNK